MNAPAPPTPGVGEAPSADLPLRFFVAGVVAYLVALVLLGWDRAALTGFFFREPLLLAAVHLLALGWITMVMQGAMYQMMPVVLETRLWSERLGRLSFWIYLAGVALLTGGMGLDTLGVFPRIGAVAVVVALLLFLIDMAATFRGARRWSLTAAHVAAALVFLAGTLVMGLLLAFNLRAGYLGDPLAWLKGHAHMAFVGWVTLATMGVSYTLLPMFMVSRAHAGRAGRMSLAAVAAGSTLLLPALGRGAPRLLILATLAVCAGGALYLYEVVRIVRGRLRRVLDAGLWHVVLSWGFLGLSLLLGALLGLGFVPPKFYAPYAAAAFLGWATGIILGMSYKIVPFLVWYARYAPVAGRERIPRAADLVPERSARVELALHGAGAWALLAGLLLAPAGSRLLDLGLLLLLAAASLYAANLARIFSRLRRPDPPAGGHPVSGAA